MPDALVQVFAPASESENAETSCLRGDEALSS